MASNSNGNATGGVGWTPPSVEELQSLLPQYEIDAILGHGGMGAVYKGKQAALQRAVAIKVLPETLAEGDDNHQYVERFKLEARAMAGLDHPAIISVHDFGQTTAGHLYFVMEFIDGMDIEQYIVASGGIVDPEHSVAIVSHVLDALDYAHSKGIVHRDIKPANVLINREGRVKIADFGLAKQFGGEAAGVTGLTMTNMAMGTPDYIAPEALDSDQVPDHRADLYAVGVMLYKMLTGKVPRGMFRMPSEEIPGLDARFDEIIAFAMESNPEGRFQGATEFRSKLDDLHSDPVTKIQPDQDSQSVSPVVSASVVRRTVDSPSRKAPRHSQVTSKAGQGSSGKIIAAVVASLTVVGFLFWWMADQKSKSNESGILTIAKDDSILESSKESKPASNNTVPEVAESQAPIAPTPASARLTVAPQTETSPAAAPPAKPDIVTTTGNDSQSPIKEKATIPDEKNSPAVPIPEIADLQNRLDNYRKARRDQIGSLFSGYRANLSSKKESAMAAGNLSGVENADAALGLLTRFGNELEIIFSSDEIRELPPLPPLTTADDGLHSAFAQRLAGTDADLRSKLGQSLQFCESELTRQNQIEDAIAVRKYRTLLDESFAVSGSQTADSTGISKESDTAEAAAPSTSRESSDGWITMFNGKDLEGWITPGDARAFAVVDGAIKAANPGAPANLYFTGEGSSPQTLKDFEITFRAQSEGDFANSGVYFHLDEEMDHTDKFPKEGHEIQLAARGEGTSATGGLYHVAAPDTVFRDTTEWFDVRILVERKRIQCWINGKQTLDFKEPDNLPTATDHQHERISPGGGAIAFQANSRNGAWYFKDLRIREAGKD